MIKKQISIQQNGLFLEFAITSKNQVKLLHFSSKPLNLDDLKSTCEPSDWTTGDKILEGWPLVQLQVPGLNRPFERPGDKHLVSAPGYRMTYVSHSDELNDKGRLLTFIQEDKETGLTVTTTMQFYGNAPVVQCKNLVTNKGTKTYTIEYISSFCYQGVEKEKNENLNRTDDAGNELVNRSSEPDHKLRLSIPHHSWIKEMNWKTYCLADLGLQRGQKEEMEFFRSSNAFVLANTGHWSSKKYLPMGYLENADSNTSLFWQIEQNGSWVTELADYNGHLCLGLFGPTEQESHWSIDLKPGESFESVPAAVGSVRADFSEAMGALTRYRRSIRRPNKDNENLPVIFNDYMNCLFGDPTYEKELPLIDAAADLGCEYYVIDAGWYDDGFWWDSVGEWKEGRTRFPEGMQAMTEYIRSRGMIPGVWLELEVMGINCPLAQQVPEDWFFHRHGKKIYDRSRYQLDFRHPGVIAHVTEVVRRVVEDYGCGYIKMDYNIEPGIGTEYQADSFGDGLLQHERAYLNWLDGLFEKYPDLVIENCSSGGLRMDYAMLSRHSIQSTSDNEDYRMYATIAANAPAAVTPEQAAIWSYPRRNADKEETIFNMVNALFQRIHQSGHLAELSEENMSYVREGINWYKDHRHLWKQALPYWPIGFSDFRDTWSCLALEIPSESVSKDEIYESEGKAITCKDHYEPVPETVLKDEICESEGKEITCKDSLQSGKIREVYLAIWKRDDAEWHRLNNNTLAQSILTISLPHCVGMEAECSYPFGDAAFSWDREKGEFEVEFSGETMARIFRFSYNA